MEHPAASEQAAGPVGGHVSVEAVARDAWASFDRWTSNLLLVLAVVNFVALLTIGGLAAGVTDLPPLVVAVTLGIAVAGGALMVGVSFALDQRRAWARTAAWYLLLVMVGVGFAGVIVDLAHGGLTIPLAAIAALVVAARKPGPLPALVGRDRAIAVGIGLVFLAVSLGLDAPAWLGATASVVARLGT